MAKNEFVKVTLTLVFGPSLMKETSLIMEEDDYIQTKFMDYTAEDESDHYWTRRDMQDRSRVIELDLRDVRFVEAKGYYGEVDIYEDEEESEEDAEPKPD